MIPAFRRSIMIPYENFGIYPTVTAAKEAVKAFCEKERLPCVFLENEVAEINGKQYDILRGYDLRGTYGIRCRER